MTHLTRITPTLSSTVGGGGLQLGLEDEKERKSTSCENLMSEELNGANELQ